MTSSINISTRALASVALALSAVPMTGVSAFAQEPSVSHQTAGAIAPLPENLRDKAAVLGYRDGTLTELRSGSNGMICLADDPAQNGFHAACYHEELEPFMARGRELRADGHERSTIDATRQSEIESGILAMPLEPRALYTLTSDQEFDVETGTAANMSGLYVIYMPYATEESTGISTRPARDRPWLMYPGRPWAHVMISR